MAVCTMGIEPCLAGGLAGEETVLFLNAQVHMVLICVQSVEFVILGIKQREKSRLTVFQRDLQKCKVIEWIVH